ncbi:outer membrane receptor protein involved in Fe transport [Aquimarina sp. EL_43]|uniref:TonB-dependent receptor domain-containing protein n=1 Tax=Aquimarina TaxID=290174 RepID=UPI000472477B|nr:MULTISPECIES: outer membrane beta-barrel family protein [Aquimarina]MBG6128745.1 outer membrane receptor protein involved in Fe transport [Aquimarina sp. EL_35]MBG6149808.1 outer membrane receptor protein involved in Fe transport [Aquimarina sp. EL_32]MBG6167505.1 outer membrane receptor protein involved in Fe transport [Aquimarina sp. EL_43]
MKTINQKVILLFFSFWCLILTAQPSNEAVVGTIQGKVIDKNLQQPIPYATVAIHDGADKIISGGISTDSGDFSISDIPKGNYTLKVQFIGYKTYSQPVEISKKNKDINVGTISLEEEAESLDDVTIVAERTTIEQKIDRKVINVGKDLTTTGGTASEIMNNIPSVNVDQDGNIALRGNQNVRILIDGKPTNIDATQLLKQIPSTSIKKIELITNPSAKYNPEGMSGIINIVLHKNSNIGFNGNINLGLNFDKNARFNSSIDLNYRTGKVNFYGNYGNNITKRQNAGGVFRQDQNYQTDFKFLDNNKSHLFKIGLDYFIDDHNTVSIYTNQNLFDGLTDGTTDITFFNNDQSDLSQKLLSDSDNQGSTYNFDYKHDFKKEGHNIELEVDYNVFESDSDDRFNFVGGDGSFTNYNDLINNERKNTTINLDYVNPLSEKTKLELGYETRLRRTDNDYRSTLFANSKYNYDRNIHSFYGTYGQNFEKWSYQLGARLESYEVEAVFDGEKIFEDDIFTVYPSGFISYTPGEKNSYQLSYSRRIDRPGLNQVNPIREWSTPRIVSIGNPELNPQFTNSIEANYTRKLGKGSITGGVFYRIINDEISQALVENPDVEEGQILTFKNFDNNSSYGVEVSSNYRATKWWSFNASFDLYSQTQKGVVDNINREVDAVVYNFRLNNSFKATKNLTFQVFGFYRGEQEGILFKTKPFYFVNTGARYNFLKGKGTASINFNDIFNTMRFRFSANNPYPQNGQFQGETQTVFLGLSYRFGSGKNRKVSRKRRDNNEKSGGGIL